jgi:hypothetical protein
LKGDNYENKFGNKGAYGISPYDFGLAWRFAQRGQRWMDCDNSRIRHHGIPNLTEAQQARSTPFG